MEFTAWCLHDWDRGHCYVYQREREGDGNWAGRRESIYSSVGRMAVAKTKIHTSRCTNTSPKRLVLIYAVTDGDGGDTAWKHRQGCRWKCLAAEHLLNVKQHTRKMMVEISWAVVPVCKSEVMFSRTLQIKVRPLCFYDFYFIFFAQPFPGCCKLVFHVDLQRPVLIGKRSHKTSTF